MIDLTNPVLLGPVQNQEHYMQGVVARRNNFTEPILAFLEDAYKDFGALTGRYYGLITEYKTQDADTVFVSLGSAAENIEAGVDYLRERRNAKVGSIHLNVFRPFPEAAVVRALSGKRNVVVLERTDEPMSGDNPMGREIRTALSKALVTQDHAAEAYLPPMTPDQMPRLFAGIYGLGSRDFRPEHILGAYEFATGTRARKDGKGVADGVSFFVLGVDHPYEVKSEETPSASAGQSGGRAIPLHRRLGRDHNRKKSGRHHRRFERPALRSRQSGGRVGQSEGDHPRQRQPEIRIGKKGRAYFLFMVAAPERIRVNCDLRHVTVVLCCRSQGLYPPHQSLDGMLEGGALIWESEEEGEKAWERLPMWARKQIIEKKIHVYTLPGFVIARNATDRADLQLRMQGNAFLGAFFAVSPILQEFRITPEQFREVVHKQYVKKFGRLGDAVVNSNMEVMTQGFERVREIRVGEMEAPDRSSLRGEALLPVLAAPNEEGGCGSGCRSHAAPEGQGPRTPVTTIAMFDSEFRSNYGYNQPASPLASVGVMAAGSGDTASKYVARRETPLYIPENCTQCMECIAVCPDTALPNCSQELDTVLRTAIANYVTDPGERAKMFKSVPEIDKRTRALMRDAVNGKVLTPLPELLRKVTGEVDGFPRTKPSASSSRSSKKCRWPFRRPTRFSPRRKEKLRAAAESSRSLCPTFAKDARPASRRAAIIRPCAWCRRRKQSTPNTKPARRS